jgi:hypothetical protein
MATSRNRKEHSEKLETFKSKKKQQMSEQTNQANVNVQQPQQQNPNALPPVREVPTWKSDEQLVITGLEFEYIYNFITSVGQSYAAAQSVMNRALLSDKVVMEFDKLVVHENGTQEYVRMSNEESLPHKEEFAKLVAAVKNPPKPVPQSPIENPLKPV